MKRQLLLIRHAKSDWGNPSISDFERPLIVRGECDAPMMGERLAARDVQIDRLVSSPARRAHSTAEAIARSLGYPLQGIDWMAELYLADSQCMMDVIVSCPDEVGTLALVGHNPGISDLAAKLSGGATGELPTCAITHLESDAPGWSEAINFRLVHLDYPKKQG